MKLGEGQTTPTEESIVAVLLLYSKGVFGVTIIMGSGTFVFWLSTVGHFNIMATKRSRSELDLNKVTCDKSMPLLVRHMLCTCLGLKCLFRSSWCSGSTFYIPRMTFITMYSVCFPAEAFKIHPWTDQCLILEHRTELFTFFLHNSRCPLK